MSIVKCIKQGVFKGLILMLFVILLNCAQQSATLMDEEYADENEEFQSELLGMLELSEEDLSQDSDFLDKLEVDNSAESQNVSAFSDASEEEDSLDDILSLLIEEEEPEPAVDTGQSFQSPPEASDPAVDENAALRGDVLRLENVYEEKSVFAEDLRRKVDEKNNRISTLESQIASGAAARTVSRQPQSGAQLTDVRGDSPFINGYRNGRAQFESFKYTAAIQTFQNLLQSNSGHSLADNCQYWIGECYFGMKKYQQAIVEFQKVFMYKRIDKHDDAQLMIALAYMKNNQTEKAKGELEKFLNTYPDSEYSAIARRYYQKM